MNPRLRAGLTFGTVVGWLTVSLLLTTAGLGLWLDFGYSPDAADAWNNIEELEGEIERGLVVADLRRLSGIAALGSTTVWLTVMAAARHRLVLLVALVFGLSVAAWWTASGSSLLQRSVLESAAATIAVVAAAISLSQLSAQEEAA